MPARRKVARRRANQPVVGRQSMDNQRRVFQFADVDQQVPGVGAEPHGALRQRKGNAHIWILDPEGSDDRCHIAATKPE